MRGPILAGAWLLAATNIALAQATPGGARDMVESYHRFFGEPAPGRPEFVRVEPQGDGYRVTFDLAAAAAIVPTSEFRIEPADLSFAIELQPDGSSRFHDFRVTSPLVYRMNDMKATYSGSVGTTLGQSGPEPLTFLSDTTLENLTIRTESPQGGYEARYGLMTLHGKSTAVGGGSVDIEMSQQMRSVEADTRFFFPADPEAAESSIEAEGEWVDVDYQIESMDWTGEIDALNIEKLSALWIETVARAENGPVLFGGAEVKEWYSELTPVYSRAGQVFTARGIRATTPFGNFAASELDVAMSIPGIVPDAEMAWEFSASEVSLPDEFVPAWARELVAKDFSFTTKVAGFDLKVFLDRLVAELDPERSPMLEDEAVAVAALDALSEDGIRISVGPDFLSGPLLALENQGELRISPDGISGSFDLTVTGLQQAIAAAQSGGSDPTAQQTVGVLAIGQMLAKPTDDGASFFRIELLPDGSVVVNGQIVKPAASPTEKEL